MSSVVLGPWGKGGKSVEQMQMRLGILGGIKS